MLILRCLNMSARETTEGKGWRHGSSDVGYVKLLGEEGSMPFRMKK